MRALGASIRTLFVIREVGLALRVLMVPTWTKFCTFYIKQLPLLYLEPKVVES